MDNLIKSDSFEFVEGTTKEDFDALSERVSEVEGDVSDLDGRLETVENTDVPLLKSNMVQEIIILPYDLNSPTRFYDGYGLNDVVIPEPIVTADYSSLTFEWTVMSIVPGTAPSDWSTTLLYLTALDENDTQVPFGCSMCATCTVDDLSVDASINHITQKISFGSSGGGQFLQYGTLYKLTGAWGLVNLSSRESFYGSIPAKISKLRVTFPWIVNQREVWVRSISVKISGSPR